jgi:transcriptional regulator with XRE-family HTH domain
MDEPPALVRRERREQGVTQAQLASRMGTTQSAIAALERPGSNPTWRTVADALDALGLRPRLTAERKPAGVDESLIRQQLQLSPRQRLAQLESMVDGARELAAVGARSRGERD